MDCHEHDAQGLDLIVQARKAADDLLAGCFDVAVVAKAMNLSTPDAFDRAVGVFASVLRSNASASDLDAVRAAVGVLDVDWSKLTADRRRELISSAMEAAGRHTALVPKKIEATVVRGAKDVVAAGRADARRNGVKVGVETSGLDRKIIGHLENSTALFVTDEYKRRIDGFREEAGRIVAEGVERGAGRAEIRDKLEAAAQGRIAGRSSSYWEVIAGAFVGRGRSFSQLSSYAEAGIERYRVEAVLDEVTTETCRYLDGKVFSVNRGLKLFADEAALESPEAIKVAQPWIRERKDPKTGQVHLVANKGEAGLVRVATVERSGFGRQDNRGTFSGGRSESDLADMGIGFPPYHGLCRSTTVPEF